MSKVIIFKGWHYPVPPTIPCLFNVKEDKANYIAAKFRFTDSCMFDLHDEDQHDVNKLFGFSIGYHKKTSFRFGWRPILKEKLIEIVAYEYHNGVRQTTMPICRVELNKFHNFTLLYDGFKAKTYYYVNDNKEFKNDVVLKKKYGLGYTLGTYFGGNEKAPHDITIYRSNYDPN